MSDSFDKTLRGKHFDEVFTEVTHTETLGLKNPEQLRLFHLNVNNNAFSSDKLEQFLRRNIGLYVFSRAQIEEYNIEGDAYSVGMDALDIMKRNGNPGQKGTGNDLGEILLYVFLEQVLGAPKIMSKVELQTGAKQYGSKCDGIHLLSLEQKFGMPYYHKPTQNAESRTGYDRALTQQINESDIICIYGMSIGDTDKKWWTLISKWLSADDKHIVIILSHQEENVIRFPHKQRKSRISIVQKLLSFSKQSEPLKSLIKERIYVGFNNDIFKMDLSIKKEDASEKFDMLPYIADYGKSIGQMFGGIENNSYDLPKVNTIGSGKGIAAISTVKGIDIPSIVDKPSTSSIIDFEQDDDSIKSISKRKPLTIKL